MGLKLASVTLTFPDMSSRTLFPAVLLATCVSLFAQAPMASPENGQAVPPRGFPAPQDPPKVVPRLLDGADPGQASIHVSLGRQRAYLSIGNEVAIDTPVSTGKPRAMTPKGQFTVLEKQTTHTSRLFGEFVDAEGRSVRSAVSTRTDAAPGGTTFRAVPVQYYLRLNEQGTALHAGPLTGYAAADASVWLPSDIAPLFFQRVKVGTPVRIGD